MAKPDNGSFWSELLAVDLYKRNQGKLARQLTAAAIGLMVVAGAYILSQGPMADYSRGVKVGVPLGISALAAWIVFRLVNYPRFAEFLISVEAEMGKVSWASKQELYRATVVVLCTMFFLAFVLFFFDFLWQWIFRQIGVLPS